MQKLVIDNETNIVENIILCSEDFMLKDKKLIPYRMQASIGDKYDGENFVKTTNILEEKEQWKNSMSALDTQLPRYAEDIINTMSATQFGKLAKETQDKYNNKKAKRHEGKDKGFI